MGKPKTSQKPTKMSDGSVVKKKKSETICKCPYNDKDKIQSLAEEVTTELRDMEELVNRGDQISACPYYASRESIKFAQVMLYVIILVFSYKKYYILFIFLFL